MDQISLIVSKWPVDFLKKSCSTSSNISYLKKRKEYCWIWQVQSISFSVKWRIYLLSLFAWDASRVWLTDFSFVKYLCYRSPTVKFSFITETIVTMETYRNSDEKTPCWEHLFLPSLIRNVFTFDKNQIESDSFILRRRDITSMIDVTLEWLFDDIQTVNHPYPRIDFQSMLRFLRIIAD